MNFNSLWIALLLVTLAFASPLFAQNAAINADKELTRSILDKAPPHILQLIDQGKVTLATNDEKLRTVNRLAITLFEFSFKHNLRIRTQSTDISGRNIRVTMNCVDPKFEMKHTVVFPSNFQINEAWGMKILKHEFDHVAITTDPRLGRLLPKALWYQESWVESIPINELSSDRYLLKKCEERMQTRQTALEQFLQWQYLRLDEVSRDGQDLINERTEFFESLYQPDLLEEKKFPFVSKTITLLKSKKFQETGIHFSRLDTP